VALRTARQYTESLRDGRNVFFRGQRIPDVTEHPLIRTAIDHAALEYTMPQDPRFRALAAVEEDGEIYNRCYKIPRNSEDLLKRSELIAAFTREGATYPVLIKEIGTEAMFALHMVGDLLAARGKPHYLERLRGFYRYCRDNDLALSVAQTDVKGDRALGPAAQEHPDYYVHKVEDRPGGIVVRGAKVHTSLTTNANELIVLPTRAMRPGDEPYAVCFALPLNTPGLKLIASPHGSEPKNPIEHPISGRRKMMETLTVFDDVFIPHERVFLDGEVDLAGPIAINFVRFHRFTAVSYKLPLMELLAGAGWAVAEANGIAGAGHVRDKLTQLAAYHSIALGLLQRSAAACTIEHGIAIPNTLLVNVAKYHFAHNYHLAVQIVQDLAGGLLVTAPAGEDLTADLTRDYIKRYLGGSRDIGAEQRLRLIYLISDMTASDYGGYQEVLAVHAEGGFEAEKLQTYREYPFAQAADYARKLAGI
jgi:4-hydroxybutyryl-CoA dehydratase / vinylacetyl-CoA-Delta-isomerase